MGFGKFFNKVKSGAQKFFSKNGEGSKILGKISSGLGTAGSVLNQVASSPIVAATLGPEANVTAGGLGMIANQSSALTNQKNYSGNAQQVQNNILERAKSIQQTAQNHPAFV
jgi:hypothetical protein